MESSKNYEEYHEHPLLLLLNQEQLLISKHSGVAKCSRCRQELSAPCLTCTEDDCGFCLHRVCADAPLELNHPFHLNHPLLLEQNRLGSCHCFFCSTTCTEFSYTYNCSCGLHFHIRCALFTFNIAVNNLKELQHVALEHVYDWDWCRWCQLEEELPTDIYFFHGSRFKLHKKCVELPHKLNHRCHRKHPLALQFSISGLKCKICQTDCYRKFVYACSPCEFAIEVECVSPSPTIEQESHPHPFNLLLSQGSFICDACGTRGEHVAYTCLTCNIVVHKECLSVPRFIKSKWHDHRLSHTYFLHRQYFSTLDCIICHDEVNTEYGSFCCKFCNVIFHVNCVTKDKDSYDIVSDDEESLDVSVNSFTVIERNDAGEATVIEHCKHIGHHLMLSTDRVREYDNKCCDGCLLLISASCYYCSASDCDFILHKVCVELPKAKQLWHHGCKQTLVLTSNEGFECVKCDRLSNSFGYKCKKCWDHTCLRCVIALTPGARTHPGHKHPLFFYPGYTGKCNACGILDIKGLFRSKKDCGFCLDHKCFSLPVTAWHKCDEHVLSLTYHDDNNYSESHYCDICEERRDPNLWFYHCGKCDTSAHVDCVIDRKRSFVKIGSFFDLEWYHRHPLTFVRKTYYYPNCRRCGQPCVDFALECEKPGCNYITHFGCPQ